MSPAEEITEVPGWEPVSSCAASGFQGHRRPQSCWARRQARLPAARADAACRRTICASWAPMDWSSQLPSLPRPSSSPARASSRLPASDPEPASAAVSVTRSSTSYRASRFRKTAKAGESGRRIRLGLSHKSRQGGIEVSLHGVDILLNRSASLGRRLPMATLRLAMVFCTFANAGRKLATGNAGGRRLEAAVAAWPRAASEPIQAPLTTSRVKTASLVDRGDGIILSPDDNGAGAVATCGGFDGLGMLRRIKDVRCLCGPVAQLGARFHGMEEVTGSIPVRSTNQINNLDGLGLQGLHVWVVTCVITCHSGACGEGFHR